MEGLSQWSGLSQLKEVITFDEALGPAVIRELVPEDWQHNVDADFRVFFFRDLEYLLSRVGDLRNRNVLALIEFTDPPLAEVQVAEEEGRFRSLVTGKPPRTDGSRVGAPVPEARAGEGTRSTWILRVAQRRASAQDFIRGEIQDKVKNTC